MPCRDKIKIREYFLFAGFSELERREIDENLNFRFFKI